MLAHDQDDDPKGLYVRNCRELVEQMIEYLDGLDADPDLEPTLGCELVPGSDECEYPEDSEPSLGSFDRMVDQAKAWQTRSTDAGIDCELDRCDWEPLLATTMAEDGGSLIGSPSDLEA